ncbi:MAG: DUF6906 family protein [Clostridium sp.]|uniref:DUF6906 family protein n=1 Tax=Clostridium sp. TaxID=1506 RepID=UPI003F33459C
MKKLKNLTRNQKKFIVNQGLDPNNYLIERCTAEDYIFFDKTKEILFSLRR